ncbi:MAG: hypothetical protein K9H61_05630 [Bacteroidia bacterium]|nr:hypothetical protein [Bacteroidia bacterium]MCF8427059.1 hypothetical protein [Bacteroidia bacterium]MCF8446457.1 hypothetical protein [Bacteroidia bacterium]
MPAKENFTSLFYFLVLTGLFGYWFIWIQTITIDATVVFNSISIEKQSFEKTRMEYIPDTLYENIPLSFDSSLSHLNVLFEKIESKNTNQETKNYLKALYLSDFVYGIFSFQLLGSELGHSSHSINIKNWNSISLRDCYNKGNKNEFPIWCENRSSFFTRLADSLLHLKSRIISLPGIHSFPIVFLKSGAYIFDPSDPYVVFDSQFSKVVSYENLIKNNLSDINIHRTNRHFGNSGLLISVGLWEKLFQSDRNSLQFFDSLVFEYVLNNKKQLQIVTTNCEIEPHYFSSRMQPTNSLNDPYILKPKNLLYPKRMKKNRFNKFYLGKNCK